MVTHYKVAGHLACGSHGSSLASSNKLNQVKCHNCRKTDVYKEARKAERNAARRAARRSKTAHVSSDWRAAWREKLADMPGQQRLPRGFGGQPFV
jgi:hypothetical protein